MSDQPPLSAFEVVINGEEQYSVWRSDAPPPPGWRIIGVSGTRQQCLDYIEKHWTDLRPLSLRRSMAGEGS